MMPSLKSKSIPLATMSEVQEKVDDDSGDALQSRIRDAIWAFWTDDVNRPSWFRIDQNERLVKRIADAIGTDLAAINQTITDIAAELGCEPDNEAILQRIADYNRVIVAASSALRTYASGNFSSEPAESSLAAIDAMHVRTELDHG